MSRPTWERCGVANDYQESAACVQLWRVRLFGGVYGYAEEASDWWLLDMGECSKMAWRLTGEVHPPNAWIDELAEFCGVALPALLGEGVQS